MNDKLETTPASPSHSERLFELPDVRFEDVAIEKLQQELTGKHYPDKQRELLEAHEIDIDPVLAPPDFLMEQFTEKDWENVHNSEAPFLTLLAAGNYYAEAARTTQTSPTTGRPIRRDPREGYEGLKNEATIQTLPLIHGMTADAFLSAVSEGTLHSNRTRLEQAGADSMNFHSAGLGTTSADRDYGLDHQVFFDYARPAQNHTTQAEITLVADPSLMDQPGTFMTPHDILDMTDAKRTMQFYLDGVTTPEYFHKTALLHITNTVVDRGESIDRTGWSQQNTLEEFRRGRDEVSASHSIPFSTYEVKTPDPPGVSMKVVEQGRGVVVVRDQDTYEHLQQELGDYFEFVHAILRPKGSIKPDYEGDIRDIAAVDQGNYPEVLSIPGLFERKMEELIEQDYEERMGVLKNLSEENKELAVVIFATTDPEQIDNQDVEARINSKTNPYRFNDNQTVTYTSMDALQYDLEKTTDLQDFSTVSGQQPWFFDPLMGQKRLLTSAGNDSCVVAIIERSKQDPKVAQILELGSFSLNDGPNFPSGN